MYYVDCCCPLFLSPFEGSKFSPWVPWLSPPRIYNIYTAYCTTHIYVYLELQYSKLLTTVFANLKIWDILEIMGYVSDEIDAREGEPLKVEMG